MNSSILEKMETAWLPFPQEPMLVQSVLVAIVLVSAAAIVLKQLRTTPTTKSTPPPKKKKRVFSACPYSAESNFLVESNEKLPPCPLELLESWMDPSSSNFGKPLGARWLEAGISGQDTPGMLRAGLKKMRDSKHFLVQEPFRLKDELMMKKKALDDSNRFPKVFVMEDDSLEAQEECLELFMSYLPRKYPDLYKYDASAKTIHVTATDTTLKLNDPKWKKRPLELCERIVQEDLVLMRPPRPSDDHNQFAMAAAAVVFSFDELQEKLGQPVKFIHAPVPGYERHLRKTLDLTFGKLLKVEVPMWRNNWGIAPSGALDKPLYGSVAGQQDRMLAKDVGVEDIKSKFLKVEYQTIRRLPRSGYLLFTVKTMADPMSSLESVPRAAKCLAASIRGMSPAMRAYKGIPDEMTCKVLLEYLDSIPLEETE